MSKRSGRFIRFKGFGMTNDQWKIFTAGYFTGYLVASVVLIITVLLK